jgi:hypothetical protein
VRKLVALGLALIVAFVVAPGPLAGIGAGGGLGVLALGTAMANAGTAADPAPALLGLFNGSW